MENKIIRDLDILQNTTEVDNHELYKVTPYRLSYSMSTSEYGIIILMLALIFITLILICIASNLKSSFKNKMANLGVVAVNVNGQKKILFQNNFNSLFQAPVDLRTTSFMNVALPDPRNELIYDWNKTNLPLPDNVSTYR